jgi:hypothetical protein
VFQLKNKSIFGNLLGFLFCSLHHFTKDVIFFITNSNISTFLYLLTLLGAPRALGLRTSKVKGHRYTEKLKKKKKKKIWRTDFLKTETILTIFDYVNYRHPLTALTFQSITNKFKKSKFQQCLRVLCTMGTALWDHFGTKTN